MGVCAVNQSIQWNHVYTLAQKADEEAKKFFGNDVSPLLEDLNPRFREANFEQVDIIYRWIWIDDELTFCEPHEGGILFDNGGSLSKPWNEGEQAAWDDYDLYFIGAYINSGQNANGPCYCCIVGKVCPAWEYFNYSLRISESPETPQKSGCEWRPHWYPLCMDLIKTQIPMINYFSDGTRGQDYWYVRRVCVGSDRYLIAQYSWDQGLYAWRLRSLDLPLTGYFGWPIRKKEFDQIKSRLYPLTYGPDTKCGKVYAAGQDTIIEQVEPATNCGNPHLEDVVWTLINKTGGGVKPGCFAYKDGGVTTPWQSVSCGGKDCDYGPTVYCQTLQDITKVLDGLDTLLFKKDEHKPKLTNDCQDLVDAGYGDLEKFAEGCCCDASGITECYQKDYPNYECGGGE